MIGRALALAGLAATATTATTAAADPIDLGPATLALEPGWAGAAPTDGGVVRQRGAQTLVVVRYDVPNLPAWRAATRAAHLAPIATGFVTAPGTVELVARFER